MLSFTPFVGFGLGRNVSLTVGPMVKYSVAQPDQGRNAARFFQADRPYGAGLFGQVGGEVRFELDRRNRKVAASRGVHLRLAADAWPEVFRAEEDRGAFGSVEGDLAVYLSTRGLHETTLALRAGGRRVFGDFPFYEAAFLGAQNSRGFRLNRFAGEAAAWGNAELRIPLGRASLLVPGEIGVRGLGDVGRVWADRDTTGTWRGSVGGGIWFAPIARGNTVSATMATGGEGVRFYLKSGFGF